MLRRVMGDAEFFAALTAYRSQYAYDSATVAEFASAFGASFGEDLSWFSDQWVMNPGSPDYEWNYSGENIGGQELLKLAIWQTQDLDGFDLFRMPIDIRVKTTLSTTVHTVWNDAWSEHYVLPVDAPVTQVEFDESSGVSNRNWVLWDSRTKVNTPLDAPPALLDVEVRNAAVSGDTTLLLTFSEDIGSFEASDAALLGIASGAHLPVAASYDAAAQQATLHFAQLLPDDYSLTILSAGISANGRALDGETDQNAWWDDVDLPSGDGQPGGDAVVGFRVEAVAIPAAGWPLRALAGLLLAAFAITAKRSRNRR